MQKFKFNINHHIYVFLTPLGESHFISEWLKPFVGTKQYDERVNEMDYFIKKMKQEDGSYQFQFHQFVESFGTIDSIDSHKYYNSTILFDEAELTRGL